MISKYIGERENLVKKLMEIHPYPKEWFIRKPTAVLKAMLNTKTKKEVTSDNTILLNARKRRFNQELGEWEVLTDTGKWEIEQN